MPINIAPASNDTNLSDLMADVGSGKIQLPDFQRGWTWDDDRIRGILASLTQGYPMGAIMNLQYGSESVRFKYRTIEGVDVQGVTPDFLVLDGQQRNGLGMVLHNALHERLAESALQCGNALYCWRQLTMVAGKDHS